MIIHKTNTHNFLVFGENLNTAMSKTDIETTIQDKLNNEEFEDFTFEYNKINPNEIVFIFHRNKDYALQDDFLVDLDFYLISGLPRNYFRPYLIEEPYFKCLIPFGEANEYYLTSSECYEVYENLMAQRGNETEKTMIFLSNKILGMRIIF